MKTINQLQQIKKQVPRNRNEIYVLYSVFTMHLSNPSWIYRLLQYTTIIGIFISFIKLIEANIHTSTEITMDVETRKIIDTETKDVNLPINTVEEKVS
jgi:hypothetical protein